MTLDRRIPKFNTFSSAPFQGRLSRAPHPWDARSGNCRSRIKSCTERISLQRIYWNPTISGRHYPSRHKHYTISSILTSSSTFKVALATIPTEFREGRDRPARNPSKNECEKPPLLHRYRHDYRFLGDDRRAKLEYGTRVSERYGSLSGRRAKRTQPRCSASRTRLSAERAARLASADSAGGGSSAERRRSRAKSDESLRCPVCASLLLSLFVGDSRVPWLLLATRRYYAARSRDASFGATVHSSLSLEAGGLALVRDCRSADFALTVTRIFPECVFLPT